VIDWITCKIPFEHPFIESGKVIFLNADDSIEKALVRRRPVSGSHSQTFTVRSCGSAGEGRAAYLSLSGNPSKFLQGHNVFGSDDLLDLVVDTLRLLDKALDLHVDDLTYLRVANGEYDVSMVDINYSFELPSQADVQTWLQQAEMTTRSRCGRPSTRPGTVYWQKHSRRWALKAYSKFLELQAGKDHQLPLQLESTPLKRWTENILRIELRLKQLELDDLNLTRAKELAPRLPGLFREYQGKIVMATQLRLVGKQFHNLPRKLLGSYELWKAGHNMKATLTNGTFYRHRKLLLEHGIDISIACPPPENSNVIPLVRVLEATPARIPDWAFHDRLVHRSAVNF